MKTHPPFRTLALGAALLSMGCGSSRAADFANTQGPSSPDPQPSGDGGASDATLVVLGEGGSLALGPPRDAGGTTASLCRAGVYQGAFMTYVGSGGDGGSAGLFSYMWNGSLTIDLTARKVVVSTGGGNGESFTTDTSILEIAEGGALDGGDTTGGTFFANLDGQLDCDPDAAPPYRLGATLLNGAYKSLFVSTAMTGNLTADYQASNPPQLVNGRILVAGVLMDGAAPFASASGTWSATWVSP